uniref:Uncharacterized protein n=1 Tax=Pararge aegeria TaxID=116150 RepID=S4NWV2_9NEOP
MRFQNSAQFSVDLRQRKSIVCAVGRYKQHYPTRKGFMTLKLHSWLLYFLRALEQASVPVIVIKKAERTTNFRVELPRHV